MIPLRRAYEYTSHVHVALLLALVVKPENSVVKRG